MSLFLKVEDIEEMKNLNILNLIMNLIQSQKYIKISDKRNYFFSKINSEKILPVIIHACIIFHYSLYFHISHYFFLHVCLCCQHVFICNH